MKQLALPIVIGVLALSAFGIAKADPVAGSSTTQATQPWTIKLGYAISTNSGSQGAFEAGVDYAFEKSAANSNPILPSIYVDYFDPTVSHSAGIVGAGVAVRQDLGSASGNTTVPYIGAGIGGYFTTASNSSAYFGAKLMGGIKFDTTYLVELNYTYVDTAGSTGAIGAEVGYCF